MVDIRVRREDIVEVLRKRLGSGLLFYGTSLAVDFASKYLRKYTKEHTEAIVGIGGGIAVEMLLPESMLEEESIVGYITDAMADYGMMKELRYLVNKEPVCWAQDANTIKCKNFDNLASAVIYLDGVQLVSGTDYTISGTDTINLTTAMASGDHDLVVVDGTFKKTFADKIRV
ncbi:MAG: hypothetical protein GXO68_05815 [Crenarchaeota archaeon]|nr:hypothetical protein [Thermoproteota archaeon]